MKGKSKKLGKEWETKGEEKKIQSNLYEVKENEDTWRGCMTSRDAECKRNKHLRKNKHNTVQLLFFCFFLYPKRFWKETKHFSMGLHRKEGKSRC